MNFPGQYYDGESGLHYNCFRYYAPNFGRYLNVDPMGFHSGTNFYSYVLNNPLTWIDNLGLKWYNPLSWGNPDSVYRADKSWNDPSHVRADNCYEYASNKHGDPHDLNHRYSFKNPGDYSGSPITSYSEIKCSTITDKAKADGMVSTCGKKKGKKNECPDGYHLVPEFCTHLVCAAGCH